MSLLGPIGGRVRKRLRRSLLLAIVLSTSVATAGVSVVGAADPSPLRTVTDANPDFGGVWVDAVNNELAVTDDQHHQVLVYSRTASGAAAPLRTISGNATLLDFPASVAVDTVNNQIWAITNDTSDRALVYNRTDNGNVSPVLSLDLKPVSGSRRAWGIGLDTVNNEVAIDEEKGDELNVYARATGTLLRTVSGSLTGLHDPHGVFTDTVNNEIYVVNEGWDPVNASQSPSITVFSRTASGNVAPLRTVTCTCFNKVRPIYVDTLNNQFAVANGTTNEVDIFSRTANGAVTPLRSISGALTGLSQPSGVFIDSTNNELVVSNWGNHSITVFSRTASGNVAPLRTLTNGSGAVVGIGNPGAVAIDTVNNEFAAANCVSHPRVAIWSRTANGQVAPLRVLEGQATHIGRSLHGVFIDNVNNEIVTFGAMENSILVFNRSDTGNVAPKRIIKGSLTNINQPQGVAVDTANNEIIVVNNNNSPPSIDIYSRTATGNVAPLRTITDDSGLMVKPVGVVVNVRDNTIIVVEGDPLSEAILTYPRTANGPTAALRNISGSATMLNYTRQLAVDLTNNEIWVANLGDRSVNPPIQGSVGVFNLTDNGNVAPKRFIQGANSGVGFPRAIWVDPVNNEAGEGDSKYDWIRVFPRLF